MRKILIVEDEKKMRELLIKHLNKEGYNVEGVEDAYKAFDKIKRSYFPVVIVDLRLPGMDGLHLMEEIKKSNPSIEVIIITAYATVETAIESLKKGARDYLIKPFKIEELKHILRKIFQEKQREEENIYLKTRWPERITFKDLVYKSKKIEEVVERVKKILDKDVTVLITGESGTGKELIARIIHYEGKRKDKPFVVINCASLPETLLESELFGHEKGAFTGANNRKIGKFEFAEGGSIFLDEIGEMPSSLQAKFLRFLQYKEFQRLGGNETVKVDVRIIAATNKNLWKEVEEGNFREDLFYRLHVFPIFIPPLRERKEDIPLLAENFLIKKYPNKKLSEDALSLLLSYSWPGNVRELENILENAALISEGKIIPSSCISIPEISFLSNRKIGTLEEMEKNLIEEALRISKGNQSQAARLLGITRRTLIYRTNKYGIKFDK